LNSRNPDIHIPQLIKYLSPLEGRGYAEFIEYIPFIFIFRIVADIGTDQRKYRVFGKECKPLSFTL
jgi:hypothetical protein